MSVKLTIEIAGPLGPEDKEILTGTTMVLLALTQHLTGEDEKAEEQPQPCGEREYFADPSGPDYTGRTCISEVGHKGRHKFRPTVAEMAGGLN